MTRTPAVFAMVAAFFIAAACSNPDSNRPAPSPGMGDKAAAPAHQPMDHAESKPMQEAAATEMASETPAEGEAAADGETAATETAAAAPAEGEAAADGEIKFGPGSQDAAAVAAGEKIFQTRCATCHGKTGRGDGVGWSDPNKKPRNYHDIEWQKNTTDDRIKRVITRGGAANGLDARMPAHADLRSNEEGLNGLVAFIREMGDGKISE